MDKDYIKSKPKKKFRLKKVDYSYSKREVWLVLILAALILIAGAYAYWIDKKDSERAADISNFEQCAAAGNPILESYPERCVANEKMFVKQY